MYCVSESFSSGCVEQGHVGIETTKCHVNTVIETILSVSCTQIIIDFWVKKLHAVASEFEEGRFKFIGS